MTDAELEALFDCLPDVVFFVKNRRGEYVVVNQTLVARLGRREKRDLVGRRVDELFPPPLGRTYRAQDEQVVRFGEPIRDQLELHFYPNGRRGWCITNKLPMHGPGGAVTGLYGFSRDLQTANERSEDYSQVAEAVGRIHTQYAERLRVNELARRAGLSVYQFDKRMQRIFGITAGQLIQKTRIEAALQRLREADGSLAEIALACGYSDHSAFTRRFRETIGMSPSEYRASLSRQERARLRANIESVFGT